MDLGIVLLFMLSIVSSIISYFQFKEKGILLNNEYIWASKQERECMTFEQKRPHYKQSAIVFLLLAMMFATFALGYFLKLNWIVLSGYLMMFINIIYAIVSSINVSKNKLK